MGLREQAPRRSSDTAGAAYPCPRSRYRPSASSAATALATARRPDISVGRSIEVLRNFDLPAFELLPVLSFARETEGWGMRLLRAPLRLTQDDVARLEAAAESA